MQGMAWQHRRPSWEAMTKHGNETTQWEHTGLLGRGKAGDVLCQPVGKVAVGRGQGQRREAFVSGLGREGLGWREGIQRVFRVAFVGLGGEIGHCHRPSGDAGSWRAAGLGNRRRCRCWPHWIAGAGPGGESRDGDGAGGARPCRCRGSCGASWKWKRARCRLKGDRNEAVRLDSKPNSG